MTMTKQQTDIASVTSRDGTSIAFQKIGSGPAIVLVDAALSTRSDSGKLARALSARFTAISFDRRGRGASGDIQPYAIEREVEDIEALIDAAGRSAFLFGSSSGAVLALEAASRIGPKVSGLFLYEPPFIVDDSQPPVAPDLSDRVQRLVADGNRNEAVKLFFQGAMGIPRYAVNAMRLLMPGWSKSTAIAHTLAYDFAIVMGTQDGKPLPTDRWNPPSGPAKVMVGAKSAPFFHSAGRALAKLLPAVTYEPLPGAHHGSPVMSPAGIAAAITTFFLDR